MKDRMTNTHINNNNNNNNSNTKMKPTYMFRDQVGKVTCWFKAWNQCEQTVGLYSLLRKITPTQAIFLKRVLEQSVKDCTELKMCEAQANNPVYVRGLCNESKEHAITELLACLPMLQPGNTLARDEYLQIIPRILLHSVNNNCHIEESRQLLSYSLIHPAFSGDQRSQLTCWLSHLEERNENHHNIYNAHKHAVTNNNPTVDVQRTHPDPWCTSDKPTMPSLSVAGPQHSGHTQSRSRDSGIGLEGSSSADFDLHGSTSPAASSQDGTSSVGLTGVGRAITSTAALQGSVSCHVSQDYHAHNWALGGIGDHIPLHASVSGPPAFTVPSSMHGSLMSMPQPHAAIHRKLMRSSSVTPPLGVPTSTVSDWLHRHHGGSRSSSNNSSEPHAPLSPQSSITSSGSGSDTHTDDNNPHLSRNTFLEENSGMRDVPIWLKSLRLHKYACLFQTMTYTEMMGLTEEWLESQSVTKGARNKIILSIKKLREREPQLQSMEKEVMEGGLLKQALTELKCILNTPIKFTDPEQAPDCVMDPYVERDLPGQITRVLGKLCTQLLVTMNPEDECFSMYIHLIDKCSFHEAFSVEQKKKLQTWKMQIQKIWHPAPLKYSLDRQRKGFGNTFPPNSLLRGQRALRGVQPTVLPGQPKWTFGTALPVSLCGQSVVHPGTAPAPPLPLYQQSAFGQQQFAVHPALLDVKQPVTRTHSAPIKSAQFGLSMGICPVPTEQTLADHDTSLDSRMESLCLSMTEHALGSSFSENMCKHNLWLNKKCYLE